MESRADIDPARSDRRTGVVRMRLLFQFAHTKESEFVDSKEHSCCNPEIRLVLVSCIVHEVLSRRCSRCKIILYCSERCRKHDWKFHNHRGLCDEAVNHVNSNSLSKTMPLIPGFSNGSSESQSVTGYRLRSNDSKRMIERVIQSPSLIFIFKLGSLRYPLEKENLERIKLEIHAGTFREWMMAYAIFPEGKQRFKVIVGQFELEDRQERAAGLLLGA
ncbi:hypothetical protein D9758_012397 [Tetrapyrgos nigripes]|uniref:MYND-type domain-containing protein n=1 Tax=Tetrapyrgos nigripes TaxID=182062 RepID=A0A8H5D7B5_9AGAR|nr:hypothetical protein D9758_012397 [Tetrapyrgos nigripes]